MFQTIARNIRALELWVRQYEIDKHEITAIYSSIGTARKYLAEFALGNTLASYTGWTHLQAFSGYSIWKFAVTNFADDVNNMLYIKNLDEDIHAMLPQILEYKGAAISETSGYFDYIYFYNGATFTANYGGVAGDLSVDGGTSKTILEDASDFLYVGDAATFGGLTLSMQTFAVGVTLKAEYWNGAWTELEADVNLLVDDSLALTSDGKISWTVPTDWATTTINTKDVYWVRLSTTVAISQSPIAYAIMPKDSVVTLLRLGSEEVRDSEWACCYYNGYIYATIPNAGNGAYEGVSWISSISTATNLQNFFIYRNNYYSRHKDSTWPVTPVAALAGSSTFNGSTGRTLTHNLGHTQYHIYIVPTTTNPFDSPESMGFYCWVLKNANTAVVYCVEGVVTAFDYKIEILV